jgi:hypothetical protein
MADRDVEERTQARLRRARETLAMMQVLRHEPTHKNIAEFHELHARHLRELGDSERAADVDERARAERARRSELRWPPQRHGNS